jgi:hypothetical protein
VSRNDFSVVKNPPKGVVLCGMREYDYGLTPRPPRPHNLGRMSEERMWVLFTNHRLHSESSQLDHESVTVFHQCILSGPCSSAESPLNPITEPKDLEDMETLKNLVVKVLWGGLV